METKTYSTTTKQLLAVPVPAQSKTYKPVSHEQLIDITLESIHQSGFSLDTEKYSSARNGNVANGRYTISNIADGEMQLQIGWQNSYDKSLSLKFALGVKIMICSNGSVSGDYGAFKKKHQGEVQTFTPQAITEYIKRSAEAFKRMQQEREAMKQIELSEQVKAELIGRMFIEQEFIQSTQLNIIKRELSNPTHNYGAENSLWELYNYTTFAMKEVHPSLWMENHIDAHSFFVQQSGLILPKKTIELHPVNQLELFHEV